MSQCFADFTLNCSC